MASSKPTILILGHSFVRRLRSDLSSNFDSRADRYFGLQATGNIHLFGVGGRTVPSFRERDLHVVSSFCPDIVILEIGTNDLSQTGPEVVGSEIEDLVSLLRRDFSVWIVCVCSVIPRGKTYRNHLLFNGNAKTLNEVVKVLLYSMPHVFCWTHKCFTNPLSDPFLPDGVHVHRGGQYVLYRSFRGAILKALNML
jgi:lysophospholipase L1-like esterase